MQRCSVAAGLVTAGPSHATAAVSHLVHIRAALHRDRRARNAPALPPAPAVPRIVVSRTRPPAVALQVREALGATLIEMGSAGAKVAAVVQGRAEVYVHAGGQYEWDSAAPVAVARAAGLHTSRIDGSPLRYNQADLLLPDLVVCRPQYAPEVLAALR